MISSRPYLRLPDLRQAFRNREILEETVRTNRTLRRTSMVVSFE